MKNTAKFLAPLLIVLMLAQAACELTLPGLMGSLVNRGVQQGGLEEGLPEALSYRGMELLKCFLSSQEQARMDAIYNVIEPESSEAQRFSKIYPAARKMTICVLREDATEENQALALKAYSEAAHTFVAYMRQAEKTGELEEVAWLFSKEEQEENPGEFGQYLRDPDAPEEFYPEGVIGKVPDDALFTLPGEEEEDVTSFLTGRLPITALTAGGMLDFAAKTFGEEPEEDSAEAMLEFEGKTFDEPRAEPTPAPDLSFSLKDGLSEQKLQQAYSLLSLLSKAPPESIEAAREQARKAGTAENRWMGSILKKRFYDELGRKTGEIEAKCIGGIRNRMLLAGFLGLTAAVLTLVLGRQMNPVQVLWLRMVFYAPVLGVGGAVLGVLNSVSNRRTAAFLLGIALLFALLALLLFVPGLGGVEKSLERGLHKRRPLLAWTGALGASALLLALELAACVVLWTNREAVANSLAPVGGKMAWFQYGVLFVHAFLLAAAVFLLGPGRKIREALEKKESSGHTDTEETSTL